DVFPGQPPPEGYSLPQGYQLSRLVCLYFSDRCKAVFDAEERNGGQPNAALTGSSTLRVAALERRAVVRLEELALATGLTARGVHRVIRVARTIADLAGATAVDERAILAAAGLRDPAARSPDALAA
ncbi:MAG: magnesium chelatase subunit ChlI family protein, partial [Candidatus Limnocylindrales bacterium]